MTTKMRSEDIVCRLRRSGRAAIRAGADEIERLRGELRQARSDRRELYDLLQECIGHRIQITKELDEARSKEGK